MAEFGRKPMEEAFPPSSGEHRIGARMPCRGARSVSSLGVLIEAPGLDILGIATNIGVGGMFVRTNETLPYATEVDVRFGRFDVGIDLHLRAIVRWVTPFGFGLQFGPLGASETRALVLLLTST
jgi:hypothetical protein